MPGGRESLRREIEVWTPTGLPERFRPQPPRWRIRVRDGLDWPASALGDLAKIHWPTPTLDCLANLLPTGIRPRFVAEELGNLATCERWWQRVVWLIGLAAGMPRLAWMMHRERRRDQAQ